MAELRLKWQEPGSPGQTQQHVREQLLYGFVAAFSGPIPVNGTAAATLVAAEPLHACAPIQQYLQGAVVLVQRGHNCSFVDKYQQVLKAGGGAMLLFDDAPGCVDMGGELPHAANASNASSAAGPAGGGAAAAPAASLTRDDGAALLQALQGGGSAELEVAPVVLPAVDAGALLLWLVAVGTVAAGALWAGADASAASRKAGRDHGPGPADSAAAASADPPESFDLSAAGAAWFVVGASAILLLLFWFMSPVFFYVLLGVFCLAAAQGATAVLAALLNLLLPPHVAQRRLGLPCLGTTCLPTLLAAPPALALAVVAVACRSQPWAWALQDALGVCLMLLVMRTLRLESLRVACVLLPLAFAYDIFWVFLQPLLFGGSTDAPSVMVEVARGAGAGESLPMLLRVPRLSGPMPAGAALGYSMLGFGDVVLPGLLAALARRIDLGAGRADRKRGCLRRAGMYFPINLAGYAAGLALTYAALSLSWFGDQGQPALLYLVPCTLLPTLAAAAARGELRALLHRGWGAEVGDGSVWAALGQGVGGEGDEEEGQWLGGAPDGEDSRRAGVEGTEDGALPTQARGAAGAGGGGGQRRLSPRSRPLP